MTFVIFRHINRSCYSLTAAKGVEASYEAEVTEQSEVIGDKHEVECETQP